MRMKLLWLAMGMIALPALAAEVPRSPDHLILGGLSYHTMRRDQNEVHNTVGATYNNFEIMTFKNSYYKQSVSLSYNFSNYMEGRDGVDYEFGVRAGGTTGYEDRGTKTFIAPFVHPNATVWYKGVGIELGLLPHGFTCNCSTVVTLMGKFAF